MTEIHTGVIDRIVDGQFAVILLEKGDRVVDQLDVSVERLPKDARSEGSVLTVHVDEGKFVDATVRDEETEQRREAARERLERLSRPLSDKDDDG